MSTERAPRFPNPHVAPRLVLYPLTGGGVALDWRLDPGLVAQARAAFVGPPPVAKLYLRRVDGASLAAAILPADPAHRPTGQARFEEPVVGSLRAELGLEDPCGSAWLLLARSNRLEAVPDSTGLATKLGARQPEARVAAEQVRLDPQPPNRQDVAPSESHAARGSGPLSPYPSADEAMIQGELHVFGRAAPGSLLDLGGHPLRVGPGGRFSFRVALDDPELLAALLARLPRLPVAERESPSFQASD
ncbi:MAG: hypothetical protein ACLFQI_09475 [Halochromatium sp.]|uniref:hypothetical protein n=1 Tax=Halochromatium sp. TaxID=2049430 RepID=UPI00397A19E6